MARSARSSSGSDAELVGAGKQPGIDGGVFGAKVGLQFAGKARGIVDQEAWENAEETREQFAGSIGHVRARAVFDLRKVSLAEATAEFLFHGVDNFGLRHGAAEAAERALDSAEGAEFVAESHVEAAFR